MKIVGLDTATMDQGDMDWGPIEALGELILAAIEAGAKNTRSELLTFGL